ncbi:hypothetical protein F2P81_010426 [Scophthalmus maximus]|uniref:Uncharacterized protein n=1 Tax=Scophthalmus maximus TaxID=52904 RepID=A0A6A4T5R9_SCOMX|nr:hypothetical protein F2P81_010426 [Scophthalmus maximus]
MKQRTKDFDQNKLKDMGKRHPVEKACGVLSTFPGSWGFSLTPPIALLLNYPVGRNVSTALFAQGRRQRHTFTHHSSCCGFTRHVCVVVIGLRRHCAEDDTAVVTNEKWEVNVSGIRGVLLSTTLVSDHSKKSITGQYIFHMNSIGQMYAFNPDLYTNEMMINFSERERPSDPLSSNTKIEFCVTRQCNGVVLRWLVVKSSRVYLLSLCDVAQTKAASMWPRSALQQDCKHGATTKRKPCLRPCQARLAGTIRERWWREQKSQMDVRKRNGGGEKEMDEDDAR